MRKPGALNQKVNFFVSRLIAQQLTKNPNLIMSEVSKGRKRRTPLGGQKKSNRDEEEEEQKEKDTVGWPKYLNGS